LKNKKPELSVDETLFIMPSAERIAKTPLTAQISISHPLDMISSEFRNFS